MIITIVVLGILLAISITANIVFVIMWKSEYCRRQQLVRKLDRIYNDSKTFKLKED